MKIGPVRCIIRLGWTFGCPAATDDLRNLLRKRLSCCERLFVKVVGLAWIVAQMIELEVVLCMRHDQLPVAGSNRETAIGGVVNERTPGRRFRVLQDGQEALAIFRGIGRQRDLQ